MSQQLEVDENDNSQALGVNDLQFTIKTNNAQDAINVTSGLANYKCKVKNKNTEKKDWKNSSLFSQTIKPLWFFSSLEKKKLMEKAVLILLMKLSVISKHFEKEKSLNQDSLERVCFD